MISRALPASSLAILVVAFADSLAATFVLPLLPNLSKVAGAAEGQWVFIVAVNGIALFLGQLAWGQVIHATNTRRVIAFTLVVKAVLLTLLCVDSGFIGLLFNRLFYGAMGGTPVAIQTLLVSEFGDKRDLRLRAMSHFGIATSTGIAAGFALSGAVVASTQVINIALLACAAVILGLAVWSARSATNPASHAEPTGTQKVATANTPLFSEAGSVHVLLLVSGISRFAASAFPILVLLLAEQTTLLSLRAAALSIAILGCVEIAGQFIVPAIGMRLGLLRASIALLISMTSAFAFFELFVSTNTLVLAMALAGIASGALRSLYSSWISELGGGYLARTLAVNMAINGVARAAAPIVAGLTFSLLAVHAFFAAALVPMACIGLTAALLKDKNPSGTNSAAGSGAN